MVLFQKLKCWIFFCFLLIAINFTSLMHCAEFFSIYGDVLLNLIFKKMCWPTKFCLHRIQGIFSLKIKNTKKILKKKSTKLIHINFKEIWRGFAVLLHVYIIIIILFVITTYVTSERLFKHFVVRTPSLGKSEMYFYF